MGDKVRAKAVVSFGYDMEGERVADRTELDAPLDGFIVGRRFQPLGTYHPQRHYQSIVGDDYEPAYIAVKETVPVWLVSPGLYRNPKLVLDTDVEAT